MPDASMVPSAGSFHASASRRPRSACDAPSRPSPAGRSSGTRGAARSRPRARRRSDLAAVRRDLAHREAGAEIDVDLVEANLDARDALQLHVDVLRFAAKNPGRTEPTVTSRRRRCPSFATLERTIGPNARSPRRAARSPPPAPRSHAFGRRRLRPPPADAMRGGAGSGDRTFGWAGRGACAPHPNAWRPSPHQTWLTRMRLRTPRRPRGAPEWP